ncbi:hypothetical protein KP78_34790 [Jeotgalibacillus soli]|uniref:Type 4 fimbrial biogenesis protein PilX N-terminal domain-containing protein n=2 Tax=Jeotgalibacillus soli TaxID=889306 RepID=A0A0C2R2P1_9BACL|nr:hypothetical protein KP78_34790 [Jeotgalibacillus soli]
MKALRNEQGYTLVLVLAMIVVITILALPLMSQTISNASQTKLTENQIQLDKMVDMGSVYFMKDVERVVKELEAEASADRNHGGVTVQELMNRLPSDYTVEMENVQKIFQFQVGYTDINKIEGGISIDYRVVGEVDGVVEENVDVVIIEINNDGEQSGPGGGQEYDNPAEGRGNGCRQFNSSSAVGIYGNRECILQGNYYIDQAVNLRGSSVLCINGTVHFTEEVSLRGRSRIYINGQAVFDQEPDVQGNNTGVLYGVACPR